jgi:hypothetical protein
MYAPAAPDQETTMADDAPSTALTVQPARALRTPVEDLIPVFSTDSFEHYGRIATVMAKASLVPDAQGKLLRGGAGQLLPGGRTGRPLGLQPVRGRAVRLVVHGKLMLEGKLVSAVLESKLGLELNHYYTGEWGKDDYRIYVTDVPAHDEQIAQPAAAHQIPRRPHRRRLGGRVEDPREGRPTKGNWKNQPDVQLQYRGDRTWARLFKPPIMLGVLTDDEIEAFAERQESRRPSLAPGPTWPRWKAPASR